MQTERTQARVLAMQAICQAEVLEDDFISQLDEFLGDERPPRGVQDYGRRLFRDIWGDLESIDAKIQSVARNWDVSRMSPVDRAILRVAVCELTKRPEIPPNVAIDEAVEIAKQFGTAESGGFVNGILDAIVKGDVDVNHRDTEDTERNAGI